MNSTELPAYIVLFALVSLAWLWFFSGKADRLRPATLIGVFVAGLLSGPIIGLLSGALQGALVASHTSGALFSREFLIQFLIVGPGEEIAKFLAVLAAGLRRLDFQTSTDGIVLGVAAALGFACGENVLYMLVYGPELTLPRLVLGNLGHAAFALFWGYALGAVLHEGAPLSLLLVGLTLAAFFHGSYNYLLGAGSGGGAMLAFALFAVLTGALFYALGAERERNRERRR